MSADETARVMSIEESQRIAESLPAEVHEAIDAYCEAAYRRAAHRDDFRTLTALATARDALHVAIRSAINAAVEKPKP